MSKSEQFKQWGIWIIVNGLMFALALAGVTFQVEWAANLLMFALWTVTVLYFLASLSPPIPKLFAVPVGVSLFYDFALAGYLAANAWFLYAALTVLQGIFCAAVIYQRAEAYKKSET